MQCKVPAGLQRVFQPRPLAAQHQYHKQEPHLHLQLRGSWEPKAAGEEPNHTMGASSISGDREPLTSTKNCSILSVPVRGIDVDGGTGPPRDRYETLIKEGLLLERPPKRDCDECTERGGECRFVELTFQCICRDGRLCPESSSTTSGKQPVLPHSVIFHLASACSLSRSYDFLSKHEMRRGDTRSMPLKQTN